MTPGIYRNIPAQEYREADGISKSDLDLVAISPAHYLAAKENPRPQTDALSVGTETHRLILEPETESSMVLKPDWTRRSKADRARWENFFALNAGAKECAAIVDLPAAQWDAEFSRLTGKFLLTQTQVDSIRAMRDTVYDHPEARELLSSGVAEQSVFWLDEDTQVLCKCRPDWTTPDNILLDIKTTERADPKGFAKSVANYCYHTQNSWYSDGYAIAADLAAPPPFIFIAVEKAPPYAVALYDLDQEARDYGRALYRRDLERYAEAKRTNVWPAYSETIETISLPAWA